MALNKDLKKKNEILRNPSKYLDLSKWEILINEETGYTYGALPEEHNDEEGSEAKRDSDNLKN